MNKPLLDQYFVLSGIYNATYPEIHKFTFSEIAFNEGKYKDTELFYTLQEIHSKEIERMQIGDILRVMLSRDNNLSVGILSRVNAENYQDIKETF